MKQLTQKLGSGEMRVRDVPLPLVGRGCVLVRNHYSLISAGTEGSTVRAARKNLLGKAKERPQQVKQVIDALRTVGPTQTLRAVTKKLDAYSPLGYSCAGEVLDVSADVKGFAVGDLVACGGGNASHAEAVSVAANLCVRLSDGADLRAASYNTLGAIALQGIRQADMRLGESCVVIGLGLVGQLTCLMLRASGVRVMGIDVDPQVVAIAERHCADAAWVRSDSGIESQVLLRTNGIGADAVIITAATNSLDPINFAGRLARGKGRVVVVGDVPTGFTREPDYYRKELDLRMSCSYGPGRYDLNYEEHGFDYPATHVRWTENRNMMAFQNLLEEKRIDLNYLTTHEFGLEDASKAYDLIVSKSEPFLGIVLRYEHNIPISRESVRVSDGTSTKPCSGQIGISFIGAGSYAQGNLLPYLALSNQSLSLRHVMTQSGTTSKRVSEKFNFESSVSSIAPLCDETTDLWFIATRHDTHADYVLKGLNAGKHVFVEKPLALNREELDAIRTAREAAPGQSVMVGFNRRFSPFATELKSRLGKAPMSMIYRVNAGAVPVNSWIHDPVIGGGRVIGECCHFIDFMTYVCGALPISVFATAIPDGHDFSDTLSIQIEFNNRSIGSLHYFANGSNSVAKEYFEVYQGGLTGILDDFKTVQVFGSGKPFRKKMLNQNKGQSEMVKSVLSALGCGNGAPIPFSELESTTLATFAVLESLRTRRKVEVVA